MKAPTFSLPEGVMVPDGKKVGDTFPVMTVYKLLPKGMVQPESVDGEPLDGAEEAETPNQAANDDTTEAGPSIMKGGMRAALMGGQ